MKHKHAYYFEDEKVWINIKAVPKLLEAAKHMLLGYDNDSAPEMDCASDALRAAIALAEQTD